MKNDATTTILNCVLATIVIICVICGYLATKRAGQVHGLQIAQAQINLQEYKIQALVNEVNSYNQQAKNPDVTRMLQTLVAKPAAAKQP